MVRRHERVSFGSAYVFPGGVLESADAALRHRCTGLTADQAARLLGADTGLDYYTAAIRELFEEAGVLLARDCRDWRALADARRRLNATSLSWQAFLESHDMCMCCDELHYFSYWVTPDALPKRYATRFFLARMPAGQAATHDDLELTDATWIRPADALAAVEQGEMSIHFPTVRTLRSLAGHASVDDMICWADRRAAAGVEKIHPEMPPGRRAAAPASPGTVRD